MSNTQRIDALDVLRGLALAGMLLVNNPGDWGAVYSPLLHASWHGLTPTDLVFPFFLFVVGAAMAYSFKAAIANRQFDWLSIYRRSFLLIAIGILLSAFPFQQSLSEWRLPGVLQRIGLCYFLVAVLLRYYRPKQLLFIGIATLLAYWAAMAWYGSDIGTDPYAMQSNLPRQIDLMVFGEAHMWKGLGFAFDPEGLLSTLPAAVTCLSGYLVTLKLQTCAHAMQKIKFLLLAGIVAIGLGVLWHLVHPINKSLWTSSYVLVTSGIACICLALIIFLWDSLRFRFALHALKVYGSNPILLFVLAGIVARALYLINIEVNGQTQSLKGFLYSGLAGTLPPKLASLSFAVLFMMSFYLLALWLYKKKIFVKL
ncbi:acyltransferase family protein [Glaciecola siphonariae]|uniref:Acyltransferase family protein n=1 Tax=Glaciecola siphonariae TaxID=521012 RepID=A0ABV9LZE2_9ALTE